MTTESIALVDMERRLIADKDGQLRAQLKAQLEVYRQQAHLWCESGLTPEGYEQASKVKLALNAALRAVDIFWRVNHNALH